MKAQSAPGAAALLRLLLVEDAPADAELEIRELKRAGLRVEHRLVDREAAFVQALAEFAPHVIISDFSMPRFDGMAALALARSRAPDTPFIFVSGTIGEEYAIRALKNGATDYVLKSNLVRLPAAVERAIEDANERRARRAAETELEVARERLTSILGSLQDVLWSVELPGEKLLYISPAAAEVYGYTPESFYSDPELWIKVVHPDDRSQMLKCWQAQFEGAAFDLDYRVVRPGGEVRWVHDRGRLVRDPAGAPARIDGMARDVTEAMESRARIARLSRIRHLLGATSSAIVRTKDRKELFDEFCRIAVSHGGFTMARVVEVDAEGKLRTAAATEPDTPLFLAIVEECNRDPATARSLLAEALRGGQPVISNSVAGDPRERHREPLTLGGDYALAALPVVVDDHVAGLVMLRARDPGSFDQEELRLLDELVSNISFALGAIAKQEKLEYLALYDPLTELPNRTLFNDRLTQALEAARRENGRLALMVFDLERFKAINDTLGRQEGDKVLREVARRLRRAARDVNRVARVGVDQFAIMLPAVHDATEVVRRLGDAAPRFLDTPIAAGDRELRLAAKAGIAMFPEDGGDAEALFRNAEATLKKAKATGERYLFYAPQINARVAEQVELEGRLRRAVERRELFLHFQPRVELATRRLVGVEALMRWAPAQGESAPPSRFIPVLEETGLILEAGRQALAAAAGAYRDWRGRLAQPPRISVNVSALQLRQRSFVEDVLAALGGGDSGVDLEITESLLMQEVEESIRKLRQLRDCGIHVALDDFGTGYSSLAYLNRLPIDTVKIDRSFVRGMTEEASDTSIVSAIISLAQALRLNVVAEGVETEQQAQLLRLLRCDQMQGFLFSPPLPREELERLLRDPPR